MITTKHPVAIEVGRRLRTARILRGLELAQAADLLNFDQQTMRTWENGFSFPPIPKLIEICRLYQCSTDEIIKGQEPDTWEGVAAMMPADLRRRVLIIQHRPAVGDLVPRLDNLTDEQLIGLQALIPQLALAGGAGMDAMQTILSGLAVLVQAAREASATNRRLRAMKPSNRFQPA